MKTVRLGAIHLCATLLSASCLTHFAAEPLSPVAQPKTDRLQEWVNSTVRDTLQQFAAQKLQSNQLAVTLVDLREPGNPIEGSYRGAVPIYPASVIKLFYLVAAHHWMEDGRLRESEELRRAMRDTIVDSYNEATHYVVDVLTGVTSGPELPADQMKEWADKRNVVNRHFASLGYTNLNINQKPWCEGPYGRERVFVGKNYENRNALTTEATARLLVEIAQQRAVSAARSAAMLTLLQRDPFKKVEKGEEPDQATEFTGKALPPGSKLWSKAGWTSTVRHDAAYVELANGSRFVLVIFTTGHSKDSEIIPALAKKVVEYFSAPAGK